MPNKIIPQYCEAADLLVIATMEWRAGNKKDALIVAAGALNNSSMVELAAAMNMFNKAALENAPIEEETEQPMEKIPPEDNNGGGNNEDDDITPAVAAVMDRLMHREYSAAGEVSPEDPYSGPGGDEENDDILTSLNEEENPENDETTQFSDLDTDADLNDMLQNPQENEEEEPDPANPEEMEKHPSEAADIEDNDEISIEDNNTGENDLPPKTSKFNDKMRKLGPDLRAIANRISIKGDPDSRACAAEILRKRA